MAKAKMPVEIRPLCSADRAEWSGLWTAYLEFYGTTVSDDVYASTFGRLLGQDDHDYNCFVAVADGRLVGLTHYLFHRHCWRIENVCYLQDLFIAPTARGLGVGRALIEAVYGAADRVGVQNVYWLTNQDNTTARQLYDRIAVPTTFMKYQRPA